MFRIIGLVILVTTIPHTLLANDCETSLTEAQIHDIFHPEPSSTPRKPLPKVVRKNIDKHNRLTRATLAGDLKRVKSLVRSRGPSSVNQQHFLLAYTPLIIAAGEDHAHIVKYLLKSDEIDVNQVNDFLSTPLMEAVIAGNIESFELVLDHPDTDVNIQDANGMTALMFASRDGYLYHVNALLQKPGIDITIADNEKDTALAWALKNQHFGIVKAIIEKYEKLKQETTKRLPPKIA